jgi:hypothetical protein
MTGIYSLKDGFGLLKERKLNNSFISLIFLDLTRGSLKKLHTLEYPYSIDIVVNKADPTTFILDNHINYNESFYQVCKIVDNTIIIGDVVNIGLYPDWFYDKCVYGLKRGYKDDKVCLLFKYLVNVLIF